MADRLARPRHPGYIKRFLGITEGLQVRLKDFLDHGGRIVLGCQVFMDELHRLNQIAGERDLDLLKTPPAERRLW
ncbi:MULTISPECIES: hypothetical protein [Neorhizobium]|uniref:hypothetical protein n=1 Tax=Neorhizobium sp. T6_25 TaxID=2093833 RepID=UPI00155E1F18|nr:MULTISPECIES: hypothetical protein [Neorhizobium]